MQSAKATHFVDVTVTITSADAIGDNLEGIGRGEADLYVGVDIGGQGRDAGNSFATHVDDDDHVTPFWTITRPVQILDDAAPGSTSISLEIWEHDECDTPFCTDTGLFESDDDPGDVNPGSGGAALLTLDLVTGRWTGTVNWPVNCVQGDGDTAGRLCFDITIGSTTGDADGDFLLDGWERNGFNADGDGTIDVDLPAMGANPGRKDLFLEIDCLVDATNPTPAAQHSHCPRQGAIQAVVQSFANSNVANIGGSTGIQLHIDVGGLYGHALNTATNVARTAAPAGSVTGTFGNYGQGGNQIPEAGNLIVDWDGAIGNPATSFYTLKAANFQANRALIFRYALFVHQVNARAAANDCTSGWGEGGDTAGNDFIVSLGGTDGSTPPNPCWGTDANGNSIGSQNQQAGTLMHELGHTLGLDHGGGDAVNNKPNYLSVMNYTFQSCSVTSNGGTLPGGCDYSRQDLNDLNENSLDECQGIDGGFYGLGPNNWNGNGGFGAPLFEGDTCVPTNGGNYAQDVNGDFVDTNGDGDQDAGEPSILSTLAGFDDWNGIKYNFRETADFADGSVPPFLDEATPQMIEEARAKLAALVRPELIVDKTGPSDAIPGDTLQYDLSLKNGGDGPTLNTTLVDTKPDGSVESFDIGTLVAGGSVNRQVSYLVECTVTDGTVLTNRADASGVDMLGNEFSGTDSVTTTVHTPVLTLTKTATASVNAGEAITYTLTYENTGSGAAAGVSIVDKLPLGVYYSDALNLGAGPNPDSAVVGPDGRWTLTWNIGAVDGSSGPQAIEFTARPGLLFTGGESLTNDATLTFTNDNGCTYAPVEASASTTITVVPPTENPVGLGYWRNHPADLDAEIRARIQATDQRFDGADGSTPDGELSNAEIAFVLKPGGNMPKVLNEQLISTYANLATRRINAGTGLTAKLATQLGLSNVAEAVMYATETLALPVNSSTRPRYSDATTVLDNINNNKGLSY